MSSNKTPQPLRRTAYMYTVHNSCYDKESYDNLPSRQGKAKQAIGIGLRGKTFSAGPVGGKSWDFPVVQEGSFPFFLGGSTCSRVAST